MVLDGHDDLFRKLTSLQPLSTNPKFQQKRLDYRSQANARQLERVQETSLGWEGVISDTPSFKHQPLPSYHILKSSGEQCFLGTAPMQASSSGSWWQGDKCIGQGLARWAFLSSVETPSISQTPYLSPMKAQREYEQKGSALPSLRSWSLTGFCPFLKSIDLPTQTHGPGGRNSEPTRVLRSSSLPTPPPISPTQGSLCL